MSERRLHFYHVILGKCICGVPALLEKKNFSVFPQQVTCPACLRLLEKKSESPEHQ